MKKKEKEHHSLEFNASLTPTVAKIFTRALGEKRCTSIQKTDLRVVNVY